MQIINVIELESGVLQKVTSFVVNFEDSCVASIARVNKFFLDKIKSTYAIREGLIEINEDYWLDEGHFSDDNGTDIFLSWSEEVYV